MSQNINENANVAHGDRIKAFKNKGRDHEELRRRRNEVSVELRKAKKEDQLQKRRNINEGDDEPTSPLQEKNKNIPDLSLEEIVSLIYNSSSEQQCRGVQAARKILSRHKNPPIDEILHSGVLPQLVKFLEYNDDPVIQFESAWALTNIASGTSEQTAAVVNAGAVPLFIKLLSSHNANTVEQAVWALGNIAGDGAELRDYVIRCEGTAPLVSLVTVAEDSVNLSFLKNLTWTLSNLCRYKNPGPSMEVVELLIPVLARLIHHEDADVVGDACWALTYLTDGSWEQIQVVIDAGVIPRVVSLLAYSGGGGGGSGDNRASLSTAAIRCLGNIVTGTDKQTQLVVDAGALSHAGALLGHAKASVQKETAWFVSNITAGTQQQIQSVIAINLVPQLIHLLTHGDYRVQREACWALCNITSGGNLTQVQYLLHQQLLPPLANMMGSPDADSKITLLTLDAMLNIFQMSDTAGAADTVCDMFEEAGGVDVLEKLQQHDNEKIYKMAYSIIDKYYSGEEGDEEGIVPEVDDAGAAYQFAAEQPQTPTGGFQF